MRLGLPASVPGVPEGDGTEGSPCKTCSLPNYDGRALYVYAGHETTVTTYGNHWFQITTDSTHAQNGAVLIESDNGDAAAFDNLGIHEQEQRAHNEH